MRLLIFFTIVYLFQLALGNIEDQGNEFAEFEDFEESDSNFIDVEKPAKDVLKHSQEFEPSLGEKEEPIVNEQDNEDEAEVEVDSEFEHFQDADEFEGFEEKEEKPTAEPKITIAKVPVNFALNWDSYYLEILMIVGLIVYFINYILGRSKNSKISNTWFKTHKQLLEENFTLVGDDGSGKEVNEDITLTKESENVFLLWCSGRTCCEGMLVELRLIKRHDIVGLIANLIRPTVDQVHITVRMNKEDMDSFIFAVASKKTASQMVKDLQDISVYCPEKKPGEKFNIPANFQVMSEIGEASSTILDAKIMAVLNKYPEFIDYIHFSDQFSGLKPTDDANNSNAVNKLPEVDKVLRFGFNLTSKGVRLEEAMTRLKPLLNMVFYSIDKVKRYRLSKEGKSKADKNRQRVEEAFLKSTHQARAEAAAARREEKKRQEKDRIMAEEDPEKQRRWEIKEEKRQAKKRAPRMKQLKVKAL
ncbi:PAT complex subunit CCDC47 [Euwallacea similis]|uniref:PAT complex subunit CCDC47 n=1 Tax=Euwallacea similis TaxID=1736056 RepID=UPI00344D3F1B